MQPLGTIPISTINTIFECYNQSVYTLLTGIKPSFSATYMQLLGIKPLFAAYMPFNTRLTFAAYIQLLKTISETYIQRLGIEFLYIAYTPSDIKLTFMPYIQTSGIRSIIAAYIQLLGISYISATYTTLAGYIQLLIKLIYLVYNLFFESNRQAAIINCNTGHIKKLLNLAKININNAKYNGCNNSFIFKLAIFYHIYSRADVPPNAKIKTFSTMLKDLVLNYYYLNINIGSIAINLNQVYYSIISIKQIR